MQTLSFSFLILILSKLFIENQHDKDNGKNLTLKTDIFFSYTPSIHARQLVILAIGLATTGFSSFFSSSRRLSTIGSTIIRIKTIMSRIINASARGFSYFGLLKNSTIFALGEFSSFGFVDFPSTSSAVEAF
jgi:hypothetical protein